MDSEQPSAASVNATLASAESAFKSSLPPRKRAKTQEEKEQRRVERILRNRRAAHASREKKRKHVELLEEYVVNLEANMAKLLANFNTVHSILLASQRQQIASQIDTNVLTDISELKAKITDNLNCSVADFEKQRQKKLKGRKLSASNISDSEDDEMEEEDASRDSPEPRAVFSSVKEDTRSVQSEVFSSNESVGSHSSAPSSIGGTDGDNDLFIKQEPQEESFKLSFASEADNLLLSTSVTGDESNVAANSEANYLQYLSPISINSPSHSSPIDLTLNTLANNYEGEFEDLLKGSNEPLIASASDDSTFGLKSTLLSTDSFSKKSIMSSSSFSATNAPNSSIYDYVGQNPEVILFSCSRFMCYASKHILKSCLV
ncbi:uncharacterized protein KQ657_001554 [Scheffersomyces spartinae]|uniref:BZIP domain-containing protein n=1 Tax=Scheffersomyces spartinae TaxID=45513 RepID=A0A9P7V8F1_9ASCO|nr:uncharacterized protein KQ657_001554 [Scheffersomyces spartinae]KAG7192771.1 hypothetical protein KQ657_001554 [Scheffersomyces spartinae]